MSPVRQCPYCLGLFALSRSDAVCCSAACRVGRHAAPGLDDVDLRPWNRRDTYSHERAKATGWGGMSALETYEADLRVRYAAGIPGPVPHFGPGYGPNEIRVEYWLTQRRAA